MEGGQKAYNYFTYGEGNKKKDRKSNCQSLVFKHMSVSVWKELKVILHPFIIINPINHPQVLSAVVKTT